MTAAIARIEPRRSPFDRLRANGFLSVEPPARRRRTARGFDGLGANGFLSVEPPARRRRTARGFDGLGETTNVQDQRKRSPP